MSNKNFRNDHRNNGNNGRNGNKRSGGNWNHDSGHTNGGGYSKSNFVDKVITTLFIFGYEMFGLNGSYSPRTRNNSPFPPVEILNTGGLTMTRTNDNAFVIVDKDDVLRLEADGFISVIPGPKHFDTLVEKVFARTRLKMSDKFHITANFRNTEADEKAFVRYFGEGKNGGTVNYGIVKAKIIVAREGRNHVEDVYVHPDYVNDADTARWLKRELSDCMQRPSGAFADVQKAELGGWLLDAKKQFIAEQTELAQTKLKKVRAKREIEIGKDKFIIKRGGDMEMVTKLGIVPVCVERLVDNGTMDKIFVAMTQPKQAPANATVPV